MTKRKLTFADGSALGFGVGALLAVFLAVYGRDILRRITGTQAEAPSEPKPALVMYEDEAGARWDVRQSVVAMRAMDWDQPGERERFIKTAVAMGYFTKVEIPNVWIGPMFYTMPFDLKQEVIKVVYDHGLTEDPPAKFVRLLNHQTNGEVGSYYISGPDPLVMEPKPTERASD